MPPIPPEQPVQLGIDRFMTSYMSDMKGQRIGLVTNENATDSRCVPVIDCLIQHPDAHVTTLFGPEHGISGAAQAGIKVKDGLDPRTGIPIYSLYSDVRKPTGHMLKGVDILLIDLPDIGCRYFTNVYTTAYVLQAAAEHRIPVIIPDRPNPITGLMPEGNVVTEPFTSFVGMYPITNRTGVTLGEAATLFNNEFHIDADLHIIPATGWKRHMWLDETGVPWIPPSPNMPTVDAALLYPGTCFMEGTSMSEGRGTTKPFEWIGAPWIDAYKAVDLLNEVQLPGVTFRAVHFTPTFQKHKDALCSGIQAHITNRDELQPVRVGLHILSAMFGLSKGRWQWTKGKSGRYFIDLLAGTDDLRKGIDAGREPDDIWLSWQRENTTYMKQRESILLYGYATNDGKAP